MHDKRIAVIGGGASGLIASWYASAGCRVVLYEKQKKIGRKLLVTGNGRCNISNRNADYARYHGHNPAFVKNVFARYGVDETERFFSAIGIPFIEEDNGKLFPSSLQASIVPKVFEYELSRKNVDVRLHRKIERIVPQKKGFRLITAGMDEDEFDSVILACGSCAYPQAGASHSGYELAASLGHRIFDPFPVILPVNIPLKAIHRMQGVKRDCAVRVIHRNRTVAESSDELLFTAYGISGPAALKVSRCINELVINGEIPELSIDFFPCYDETQLMLLIKTVIEDKSKKLSFALLGILKERMPEVILEVSGFDPDRRCGTLSKSEINELCSALKNFRLLPGKPRSFDEAVAAAGGVDVSEVDPSTMESRIVKNLYITGELLDIDGDSGGFNLQFAWSTGALAGMSQVSEH